MATIIILAQDSEEAPIDVLKMLWAKRLARLSERARGLAEKNIADMLTSLQDDPEIAVKVEIIVYRTALEVWRA